MSIVQQSYEFLQTKLLPRIPLQHQRLFSFGFSALTMQPFVSLNSNARVTVANRNTAESKIRRIMKKEKMLDYFSTFVTQLQLVSPKDRINVDFSTFCGYQVLTFAKQTNLGRAIPVYIAAITYPIEHPGSQTQFIIAEVKKAITFFRCSPHFVFDRGFELPYLADYLVKEQICFTIRMRKDKHIWYLKKDIPLRNLPWFEDDIVVDIYEKKLRVVRSEKKKDMKEPWYLLTNDFTHTRDQIIAGYYFRFEIEETFKDLKYIFDLKQFYRIKTKQTFLILLWFYILGIWLSFLLPCAAGYMQKRIVMNIHKKLSLPRLFFEMLQLEKNFLFFSTIPPSL